MTPDPPASTTASSRSLSAELFTVDDLAALLQVSRRQIWRMEADGRLPAAVRMGKLTRWPKRLIDRWLDDRCPKRRPTTR